MGLLSAQCSTACVVARSRMEALLCVMGRAIGPCCHLAGPQRWLNPPRRRGGKW